MNEIGLQILLLLAYLAIGLLSVTFPIYAISVNYLSQEEWESKKDRKRRIDQLKEEITESTIRLLAEPEDVKSFRDLKRRITRSKAELSNLKLRAYYLTARGAVLRPLVFLIISLLCASIGIYSAYENLEIPIFYAGVLSGTFSVLSIGNLYKTISAVEFSALRSSRTIDFFVLFEDRKKTKDVSLQTEIGISIGIRPEKFVENLFLQIFFPPQIEIKKIPQDCLSSVQPARFDFSGYTMVYKKVDFSAPSIYEVSAITVLVAEKGSYEIPIWICGKGISRFETELTINAI